MCAIVEAEAQDLFRRGDARSECDGAFRDDVGGRRCRHETIKGRAVAATVNQIVNRCWQVDATLTRNSRYIEHPAGRADTQACAGIRYDCRHGEARGSRLRIFASWRGLGHGRSRQRGDAKSSQASQLQHLASIAVHKRYS
jgi:hypothetical protein